MKKIFPIFFILLFSRFLSYAGCTPASPGATACSSCNAADGDVITSTKCYSGSGTFASYTINAGGLLRVCGTLTITSLTLGTGSSGNLVQIVVESGGSLTINGINSGGALNNYTSIYNRGTLTINAAITISSSNTYVVTDIASASTTYNNPVTLSTGSIVNRGSSYFNAAVQFNGTATFCAEKSYTEWNYTPAWAVTLAGNSIQYGGSGTNDAVINYKGANLFAAGSFGLISANQIKLCRNGSGDNPPTNYSPATYQNTSCGSPVPVVLSKFYAKPETNGNTIIWETVQEFNNDHFEIEKSYDGVNFEKIASIKGNGNKNSNSVYYYFDEYQNSQHAHYYRLKQVDFDGWEHYSSVIYINGNEENPSSINIYPNPLEEGTTLYAKFGDFDEGDATVALYDLAGKMIDSYTIESIKPNGIYEIEDKELLLAKGTYLLEIKTPQHVYNQKLDIK